MIELSHNVTLDESELEFAAIRAQGAGGQNVNKVSSAIHLRFDIRRSSLPDFFKERLLALSDHRITRDGVIIIKGQQYRNQEQNREDAIRRLQELINEAVVIRKQRRPTKPSRAAKRKRVDSKTSRGKIKALRGRIDP
ncbi:aminoacyl-tRNA hydrolase [Halopseudomonas nanhaiensis]|uniref:alternative ribosome rescue aminoacyl-tRNA hydrolase ArfB n=1 Tax=Halopseudomonas nanhaiensis TaxID=2830842 RepID=UPI001CBB4A06|nr:alternative ribosome rescue aminoacyl-tRNA hydrolase ArfB [Halopseudomonas nanhaiensis]UAW99840.1 aminoacyl-tRNA hydrolase [Halopseudomonas nanhaiensis]